MTTFEYNPFAEVVTITYYCPICGHKNIESFVVPTPDWAAESHHDSVSTDVVDINCNNCGREYKIELATGISGGEGKIQEVEDICIVVEELPHEDDYYDSHFIKRLVMKHPKLLKKLTFLTKNQNVLYIGFSMPMSLPRWNYI